ncbi:MAG TPA: sulfotransferase [Steroidobacteraceae bacterium]|nr:sulfotransferase [Steroidobacteraceae bacterium]
MLEAPAALQAARRSLAQGDAAAARRACRRILRRFPDEAGAWHLLGVIEQRGGDPHAAMECLRRAAEAADTTALYVLSYAELCLRSRDRCAALALTRRALALDPGLALAWFSLGVQLCDAREYAEAQRSLERALELSPGLWQARAQLATLQGRLGHIEEAEARFQALLREEAHQGEAIGHYAAFLQQIGRHAEAAMHLERAVERSPQVLDHHLRAADLELQRGRAEAALRRIESIEARWSDDPALLASKATVLRLLDRHQEAAALCRGALERGCRSADLERAYAQALHLGGADEEALAALDRAAQVQPARALAEKAVLLGQLGRLSEARSLFDQALSLEPALVDAWYDRANAKTFAPDDPDVPAMERLLESASYRERMLLHFALGKAYIEGGASDPAFVHWHEGNRLKRALLDYDVQADAQALRSIATAHFEPAPARRGGGARASQVPVFVVGMPRCGSSLLEQIVASHPQAHGGGEQLRLRDLFAQSSQRAAPQDDERTAEAALRILARRSPRAARVVDKDLMNFKYLALIQRIFPNARIIHCRRDPLDTCFSAYTKLFVGELPFTYDLRELGAYYRGYDALMARWRSVLPPRNLLEVHYETLVSRPVETTRQILDFLALPWNEACVRFFETQRSVDTASLAQVRRPIYRSSVGRSAALLAHLRPLAEALGGAGRPP